MEKLSRKLKIPLLALIFISLFYSCGTDNTGSLTFKLLWENTSPVLYAPAFQPQALPSGVVSLRVTVSASDMDQLIQTFSNLDATTTEIIVKSIKAGENREVLIEGFDSSSNMTHRGTITGVRIEAGKINDAGTITMQLVTFPLAPSNLVASVTSSSQIDLSWSDNSDNEDGFAIERKTGVGGTYTQIGTVTSGVMSFQDSGLDCETEYYYRVNAYNGAGSPDYSDEVNATTSTCSSTAPTAPSGLTTTVSSSTQINLSWTDNSDNEDGFKIERKTGSGGSYSPFGTAGANAVSYQDTGLTCETNYYYRVRANNGVGDSSYSNESNATTSNCPLTAPTAPSNLTSTVISYSRINIYWTDNSNNEEGFKIERKTSSGGTYTLIYTSTSNATTYSDTGLAPSTAYYYRGSAYNLAGNSGYSNEANATTQNFSIQMASIPTGCFDMGDSNEGPGPVHNVCISAFQMNVYEVTNAEYKACVDAGSCTAPGNSSSTTRSSYYGNSTYDNYPVIYVDWSQAKAFCQWAGGRLPTEAEWEYAARGGLSGKRFPWGDTISCANANYHHSTLCSYDTSGSDGDCVGDTSQVGDYAVNGYGLYDMAGNVFEWVNDWYDGNYYSTSPTQDPQGPQGPGSDYYRVFRGGYFGYLAKYQRVAYHDSTFPSYQFDYVGFRCGK